MRSTLTGCLLAGLAAAWPSTPATARTLRNDSVAPGTPIAFYQALSGGDYVAAILDVPADVPDYQICSVSAWIGPNDFNVFQLDIFEPDASNAPIADIYRSDLDAYQLFGSEDSLNEIDLRDERIIASARRLYVRLTHVEGFPAPPGIASDADGITPGHNLMMGLQRNGNYLFSATEDLPENGAFPQPPGDWIIRATIAGPDEDCPQPGGVLPDAGVIQAPDVGPPPDAGAPPTPDVGGPKPDGLPPDLGPGAPDAEPPPRRDGAPPDDSGAATDARLGALELLRVTPNTGAAGVNTPLTLDGRGFPLDGDVRIWLGDVPALDVDVLGDAVMAAVAPAELPPGAYDVEVERGDGARAALPGAFTVLGAATQPLALTGVIPASILAGSTPELTLLGHGFTTETEFFVGPVLLQGLTLVSDQRATAVLSTGLGAGTYAVTARQGPLTAQLATPLSVFKAKPRSEGCGCQVGRPASLPMPWGPGLLLAAALGVGTRGRRRSP